MYRIIAGDCIDGMRTLSDESVHCVVTSPPYYGLRDYGVDGQIGLEASVDAYVAKMVDVFREVRRILRNDGTLWLNLGDSYANTSKGGVGGSEKQRSNRGASYAPPKLNIGLKPKNLIGIPWRVAFALQSDGWILRQDIIWHKPNPMPESVKDRCTKAHEYVFLLAKSERYYYDADKIREPSVLKSHRGGSLLNNTGREEKLNRKRWEGTRTEYWIKGRNRRSVWTVATRPNKEAHFATYPPQLIEPCILAGSPRGGVVFDPFTGSGTTAAVAIEHGRTFVGTELNTEYVAIAERRLSKVQVKM